MAADAKHVHRGEWCAKCVEHGVVEEVRRNHYGKTEQEDLRTKIDRELCRDGQLDWDECSRLADLLSVALWNELSMFPIAADTTGFTPATDTDRLAALLRAEIPVMPTRAEGPGAWTEWYAEFAANLRDSGVTLEVVER